MNYSESSLISRWLMPAICVGVFLMFGAMLSACNDKNVEASRLRPILMTAFSFILGVVPLVVATGAGAEMRQALGVAVFSGMLGVTFFGLIFTPVFYVLCRKLSFLRKSSVQSETREQMSVKNIS